MRPDPHPRTGTTSSIGWLLCALLGGSALAQHATEVVEYVPGAGTNGAWADPSAALGAPTRMSGTPQDPTAVTPFQPAWMPGQLVTVGAGGRLVLAFEQPVRDDPGNPHGIDLIIFGNAFFTGADLENPCVGALYDEGGVIEVSANGTDYVEIVGASADGLYPTLGYRDADPFGAAPGLEPTDFTRPVDPALASLVLEGLCWEDLLEAYDGSGGGTPIDLDGTGLESIRFVRISTPIDAMSLPEIDAVADVSPAPPSPDLDGNGRVDGGDLTLLLGVWNGTDPRFDLDGDGTTDGRDLVVLLGAWS